MFTLLKKLFSSENKDDNSPISVSKLTNNTKKSNTIIEKSQDRKNKVIIQKLIELEVVADIDVTLLDSRIFTINQEDILYICIEIQVELEDFESIIDAPLYARTRLLIILGIISFLTQEAFTPIDAMQSISKVDKLSEVQNESFLYDDIDFIHTFQGIVKFINKENQNQVRLFYSLIDRWRKALFLQKESEENMLYDDEAILSYFHILELLSDEYYKKQKEEAVNKINEFSKYFLSEINFLTDYQLDNEVNSKIKVIKEIMLSHLPIKSKILYMLNKQGLLTNRLNSFISQITDDRNSVAHGRKVFQEKLILPFPPFFPLIKNTFYSLENIRCLSGHIIAKFINTEHLKDEWDNLSLELQPTLSEIKSFIENEEFKNLSNIEFYEGKFNNITTELLTYTILDKEIDLPTALKVFSNFLLNYSKAEDETIQATLISILLVDIAEKEVKNKCLEVINYSYKNDLFPAARMRDILYDLEILGFNPIIFRNMIINEEIR